MANLLSDFINDRLPYVPMTGPVDGAENVEMPDDDVEINEDTGRDNSFAECQQYVRREYESYKTNFNENHDFDGVSSCNESFTNNPYFESLNIPEIYRRYKFNVNYRTQELPIDYFKSKIVEMIAVNPVVVIHGPTGCGKTTQVPQYILDYSREKNLPCKIIVTQPRRIAAINLAQRVCEERGWPLGTVCGYQVGLNKQTGEDSILTYVTTEILLQILINYKNLNNFTHIIIDEVHERNKALDFLLLIVRKYLFTNSPHVKIVLMSATMDAEEFSHYFRSRTMNSVSGLQNSLRAPILHINRKTCFTTNIFYIDQMSSLGPIPEYNHDSPEVYHELYNICFMLINAFDKIDEYDMVTGTKIIGSVLVFLPGFHEIEEAHKLLEARDKTKPGPQWEIIPIHSSLSKDHQAKAFERPKPGVRKIILSTNIAESSITVPDVYYVIDFCLTKIMKVNPITNFSTLALEWASKNNCIQRAGRVGRVANGRVYRLVPRDFYQACISSTLTPELQRAPLENIILYMKMMGLNDTPKYVLGLALSPPHMDDVDKAVLHLKEIGALLQTFEGRRDLTNGDMTFLGNIMSILPIDVNLSKMIILGQIFSCLNEAIIMAAGSTIQNLFIKTFQERILGYRKRLIWADSSCSDFIALLNLYDVWQSCIQQREFRNVNEERSWCKRNYINHKGIKEWQILINEIYKRLEKFHFVNPSTVNHITYDSDKKPAVLKVIICGAFYPNYFIKPPPVSDDVLLTISREVGGKNPFKTIYFRNMKQNQPGHIYTNQVKKLMNASCNIDISFDSSSKIYIEYNVMNMPQTVRVDGVEYITTVDKEISDDIYEAIRKRQLNISFPLKILPDYQAWDLAKRMEKEQTEHDEKNCYSNVEYTPFPALDIQYLTLIITARIDPGYFHCQNYNDETTTLLNRIFYLLNRPEIILENAHTIEVNNKIYAARYYQDNKFYRCRIVYFCPSHKNEQFVQVMFIDYGNTQKMSTRELCELPSNQECYTSPIAMCCALSEIKPKVELGAKVVWSVEAKRVFSEKTDGLLLHGKVYSVVDGILHLELYSRRPTGATSGLVSLNEWLITNGYAEKMQENAHSILDHEKRLKVLRSDNPNLEAERVSYSNRKTMCRDLSEYPEVAIGSTTINLRGPYSPLETKVMGVTRATKNLSVNIDQSSVNTVIFDTNPQCPHARLLVAGNVIQSSGSDRLKLSHTTFMPQIPGFPMLMTLLFCPLMEPKLIKDGTRVGAILCGLGAKNDDNISCYAEHDLILELDTELDANLILKICELRFIMNKLIDIMKNIYYDVQSPEDLLQNQQFAKKSLFNLLHIQQKAVKPINVKYADVWNKSLSDDVEVMKLNIPVSDDDIWPLLWFVRLKKATLLNEAEKENLEELSLIAQKVIPEKTITCKICDSTPLMNIDEVRLHLMSNGHKLKLNHMKTEFEEMEH